MPKGKVSIVINPITIIASRTLEFDIERGNFFAIQEFPLKVFNAITILTNFESAKYQLSVHITF